MYGFPEYIHLDQGANFESSLITELLLLAGAEKSYCIAVSPYGEWSSRENEPHSTVGRTLVKGQVASDATG